jgi:hypothetical protein
MNSLEENGLIDIKRPAHYTDGDTNEYKVNYLFIMKLANEFRVTKDL